MTPSSDAVQVIRERERAVVLAGVSDDLRAIHALYEILGIPPGLPSEVVGAVRAMKNMLDDSRRTPRRSPPGDATCPHRGSGSRESSRAVSPGVHQ